MNLTAATAATAATHSADLTDVVRTTADRPTATEPTPGVVHAARTILIVHGLVVLALGVLLVREPDPQIPGWLATVTVVEGAMRVLLGIALHRARALRTIAIVLAVASGVVSFASGGVGILFGLVSVAVVRCLFTEDAKRHFAK